MTPGRGPCRPSQTSVTPNSVESPNCDHGSHDLGPTTIVRSYVSCPGVSRSVGSSPTGTYECHGPYSLGRYLQTKTFREILDKKVTIKGLRDTPFCPSIVTRVKCPPVPSLDRSLDESGYLVSCPLVEREVVVEEIPVDRSGPLKR